MHRADGFYGAQEIRARLSVNLVLFGTCADIEQMRKRCTDRRITKIELGENPKRYDMADRDAIGSINELVRSCRVQIVAFHADKTNFDRVELETGRIRCVDRCKRQIDRMMEIGGTVWSSHALRSTPALPRSYDELARYDEGTNVRVALDNFASQDTTVAERVAFLDDLDHVHAGLLLDIGHVKDPRGSNPMTRPGGPARIINLCRHRLCHLHLHGYSAGRRRPDDDPPMIDGDTMQWVEVFRTLRQIDYQGGFTFEPWLQDVASLALIERFPACLVALAQGWRCCTPGPKSGSNRGRAEDAEKEAISAIVASASFAVPCLPFSRCSTLGARPPLVFLPPAFSTYSWEPGPTDPSSDGPTRPASGSCAPCDSHPDRQRISCACTVADNRSRLRGCLVPRSRENRCR